MIRKMTGWKNHRGFTLLEAGIAVLLLAIVAILALNFYNDVKRAQTGWKQGKFTLAPQTIQWAPQSASFVFAMTSGVGVDKNGQPVGSGIALRNYELNFELIGSGGDSGIIQSLNTTTINTTTGTAATDAAGIVVITIQVDDDGPYILKTVDPASGAEERHLFMAGP
jgi:type II secretory pathway pseudopilin PulG